MDDFTDDRFVYFNSNDVVRVVDQESETIKTELLPTDDPDKYLMRISVSVPRYLFKTWRAESLDA